VHNRQQGSHRLQTRPPVWSYFKRPKSSPVRPLACNWYYCALFIAKPKAARKFASARRQRQAALALWATVTSSIKPEVHDISLHHQRKTEPRPYVTYTEIWGTLDVYIPKYARRQTQTHTHTVGLTKTWRARRRAREEVAEKKWPVGVAAGQLELTGRAVHRTFYAVFRNVCFFRTIVEVSK